MQKYQVVTAFDGPGYKLYGKQFLESYLANWDIPIHVYYEGDEPSENGPVYYNRLHDDSLIRFRRIFGRDKRAHGYVSDPLTGKYHINYRYDAVKFANKVFALRRNCNSSADWLIWIDADVVCKKPVTQSFLDTVCNNDYMCSYIGRTGWSHSECGFMTFRMGNEGCRFLLELAEMYSSGAVFRCMEWHDSWIFDLLREKYYYNGTEFLNLAHGNMKMHPWPDTILGEFMDHYKGPEAKEEYYGSV